MPASVSTTLTPNASRYLQQLCRHWTHKFPVSYSKVAGRIDFGEGTLLHLQAEHERLILRLSSREVEMLARMEKVVAEHLLRFAFREELSFSWRKLHGQDG